MYRRPKFLEVLIEIREELAAEADYDVELLAEQSRAAEDIAASRSRRAKEASPPALPDAYYTEFLENLQ
jgi:hypothetical protein